MPLLYYFLAQKSRYFNRTFNLPSLTGRTVFGANNNLGTYTDGELPRIYGHMGNLNIKIAQSSSLYNGALSFTTFNHEWSGFNHTTESCIGSITFDAYSSTPTYWRNDGRVIPRNVATNFLIKY